MCIKFSLVFKKSINLLVLKPSIDAVIDDVELRGSGFQEELSSLDKQTALIPSLHFSVLRYILHFRKKVLD